MKFPEELQPGRFLRRYKRFFAEIEAAGQTITAHVPNTGSLKGCLREGAPCLYAVSKDPARKLPYTLQLVQDNGAWVGVNSAMANDIVWEGWQNGSIAGWKKFDCGQREVKIHAKSRLDMAFWKGTAELTASTKLTAPLIAKNKFHFVEVKSVTMAQDKFAMFPDCVTERGQKHLQELIDLADAGHKTEIFFAVQRSDCQSFAPADSIDPAYGRLLRQAIKSGVKISAYGCDLSAIGVTLKARPLGLEI